MIYQAWKIEIGVRIYSTKTNINNRSISKKRIFCLHQYRLGPIDQYQKMSIVCIYIDLDLL